MHACKIDYSEAGMTFVGVVSIAVTCLLFTSVRSDRYYFNRDFSNSHSYAINKRQLSHMTPALCFGTHQAVKRSPSLIYGKLNQNLYHRPVLHVNENASRIINSNIGKVPNDVPHGALGHLNNAFSRKEYLLQSLNNPFIYVSIKPPTTTYIETAENTSNHPATRRTHLPLTETVPYSNKSEMTEKSLNIRPYVSHEQWNSNMYNNYEVMAKFIRSLDSLERKFYKVTFAKLTSMSPADRKENGISFVQTGLFLQLALMALSSEVEGDTRREIDECIGLKLTDTEKIYILREIVSSLPQSDDALKFRSSSRFVLGVRQQLKPQFQHGLAPALRLHIDRINIGSTAETLTKSINKMVEKDSGGAMRDTFEEEELSDGICAILLSTVYLRARWRSAPTVLNGTHAFHDSDDAPERNVRMIRINDIMRYTELNEWDAEAIEIFYATPGLSLLLLVPRGRSLRKLSAHLAETSIHHVLERMYTLRMGVTLPLYTLRMTLLIPNKLQTMGISRLVEFEEGKCDELRLSHAVQRLMFWAEAGRNAFKDDGIEWDETPELEMVVNRPYAFFVRWRNITIMNGHFVL